MAQQGVPVSGMQRLWLRELGVGRWQLPAAPPPPAPAASAVVVADAAVSPQPASAAASVPVTPSQPRQQAGADVARAAMQDALAELSQGRRTRADAGPAKAPPVSRPATAQTGNTAGSASAAAEPVQVTPGVRAPLAEDMEGLKSQVLACTACGLCETRRQAVFGDGAIPTRWMVIGEAPGEQEDRQGSPFVGRAGQLLSAMLAAVGLKRGDDVFIANVIKCRPPANRNPRPEEIAACSPYLMRQIDLLQPERILVLGRFAAHTLLQSDAPISSLRGQRHVWQDSSGREIPLVVSYHPAYLLRSPHAKAAAWQDLQLAIEQA